MATMIDPPSGWMYGFPKIFDKSMPLKEFLLNNGYPKKYIEIAETYSWYWETEDDED